LTSTWPIPTRRGQEHLHVEQGTCRAALHRSTPSWIFRPLRIGAIRDRIPAFLNGHPGPGCRESKSRRVRWAKASAWPGLRDRGPGCAALRFVLRVGMASFRKVRSGSGDVRGLGRSSITSASSWTAITAIGFYSRMIFPMPELEPVFESFGGTLIAWMPRSTTELYTALEEFRYGGRTQRPSDRHLCHATKGYGALEFLNRHKVTVPDALIERRSRCNRSSVTIGESSGNSCRPRRASGDLRGIAEECIWRVRITAS